MFQYKPRVTIKILIFLFKLHFASSDDMSVASTNATASSSPAHHSHYSDDYYALPEDIAQSEHYIYVTYPPDLKRRLLER